MTPMTRALLTNCTDTLSLCLGLTPATERWDGRPSQISQTRHPPHPHPRSVDFVRGQYPAQISAAHWSQTHSGPFQRLGGVVASRQSRAGQLIQPADPWICWWFLSFPRLGQYILIGICLRGGFVIVTLYQKNVLGVFLSSEMDSAGRNYLV